MLGTTSSGILARHMFNLFHPQRRFRGRAISILVGIASIGPPHGSAARAEPLPATAAAMAEVRLPGMSLELPGHPYVTSGDYRNGHVIAANGEVVSAGISWRMGERPSEDELKKELQGLSDEVYVKARPPDLTAGGDLRLDGNEVAWGHVGKKSNDVHLLVGTCGGRVIRLAATSYDTVDRMRATFRCHPDPVQALAAHSVPVRLAVAGRAGWHRIASRSDVVLAGADHLRMALHEIPNTDGVDIEIRVATLSIWLALTLQPQSHSTGDHVLWNGTMTGSDNKAHPVALVAWPCRDIGVVGVAVIYPDGDRISNLKDGVALAMTGRCLAEGEAYPSQLAAPTEDLEPAPRSKAKGPTPRARRGPRFDPGVEDLLFGGQRLPSP